MGPSWPLLFCDRMGEEREGEERRGKTSKAKKAMGGGGSTPGMKLFVNSRSWEGTAVSSPCRA